MGAGDELVDLGFVFREEGVNLFLVEIASALGLGEDEVEEEEEAEVAVEGDPGRGSEVSKGSQIYVACQRL